MRVAKSIDFILSHGRHCPPPAGLGGGENQNQTTITEN